MTEDEEFQLRLLSDEDFIDLKRFNYSIREALVRYPEGLPDRLIAQGLHITEEQVAEDYRQVVLKLRSLMLVDEPDKDDDGYCI